jgi:SAM-dependent methyltransferase
MQNQSRDRGVAVLYAVTIFLSAFLLFQVQPILGKFILPWFGGSPAVWTTCMLVYQVLLFAGYAYAHATTQCLPARQQALLHIALLVVACCLLPIYPDAAWKPGPNDAPAWRVISLTLCTVGVPYFLLSSTGPLVQSWFSRKLPHASPFRLYALSNLGSLIALVSYPFVVEPTLGTPSQALIWSILFGIFALLCAGCAGTMWNMPGRSGVIADTVVTNETREISKPSTDTVILWFCLAMVPSVFLLAVTNQVCQDVAVIPFLWVVPLALYLLTFILAFDATGWYSRRWYPLAAAIAAGGTCWLLANQSSLSFVYQLLVYFSTLFACCMVCHCELVNLKPDPRFLTKYYLIISAGGAAGGLFVALVAPLIFTGYYELQLVIVAFVLVYLGVRTNESRLLSSSTFRWGRYAISLGVLIGVAVLLSKLDYADGSIALKRNFYGVLRVRDNQLEDPEKHGINLVHGRILHGFQYSAPNRRKIPTTYYAETSGVGQVLKSGSPDKPRRIGMIGLGIGTLASYGRAGDQLRFYEINPDVIDFAERYFSYLKDCPANVAIVLGDARLVLEHEESQAFDVLVIDAFSGDAIPVHLLTKEAWQIYLRHLKPDGIIACHISNNHFDLLPVVNGFADEFHLALQFVSNGDNYERKTTSSKWCLLARDESTLQRAVDQKSLEKIPPKKIHWSDDWNNLMEVLR